MTTVVDASVVVAALSDDSEVGRWAEDLLAADGLAAPHLMLYEVGNILRRASLRGDLSPDVAELAHADLLDLTIDLIDYESVAIRTWALRPAMTIYDAAYVGVAEALDAPLATLDLRTARAPGPRCRFLTPGPSV